MKLTQTQHSAKIASETSEERNAMSERYDWLAIENTIQQSGYAVLDLLLDKIDCEQFATLFNKDELYRTRIQMNRHGFGRGEYKYFTYPLPEKIQALRQELYGPLAEIANRWNLQLGKPAVYPDNLSLFLSHCHSAGQVRPTPLIFKYMEGDYNNLHQDLYGEFVFPLQIAILLSVPGEDFTGGEFIVTQSIGADSRSVDVVPLKQGDGVIFPVHSRPVPGKRGRMRRAVMRHGVSRIRYGQRHTLGLIFHDSR
ncbi:hypothetical protein Xmau_01491 [Xenorhabdus mauleonii]|uniref:Fe2OG dioxygenase domain-containing protein n=1 Tax=Xenorhabdus mauleonii TaxID=351675 RepID=A0A1I3PJ71_9GAMM|nr:2OG-Fe(II) oxygenase [Xenorhabdus mauleonii]PHM44777.1 hypothetical protein Xmau_01491 [Xenorhabdus mauleonii]SFJ21724.1 hypothetical protein SAMN05421680_106170 [Xenorhabdus mauleonii]